tara:strand:+ start:112 stop:411 length:300 start_codon:yes stop_codon:yes gene_type:complete
MKTKKHYLLFTILLLQVSYSNAQLELNDFITELNNPTGLVIHGDDLYFSGINNKIFKVNTQIKNSKPIEVFQGDLNYAVMPLVMIYCISRTTLKSLELI